MEFTGPSKHYLRQQVTLAIRAMHPLSKLDSDSELQGLEVMLALLGQRRAAVLQAKDQADEPG